MLVIAVVAGFGLTAFCAALFRIRNFWVLLGLVGVFGFGVPALVSLATEPMSRLTGLLLALSFGLALSIVVTLLVARSATRRRREHRPPGRSSQGPAHAQAPEREPTR